MDIEEYPSTGPHEQTNNAERLPERDLSNVEDSSSSFNNYAAQGDTETTEMIVLDPDHVTLMFDLYSIQPFILAVDATISRGSESHADKTC